MTEPRTARPTLRVSAAGDTHIGGREHNEDTVLMRPDLHLYMVADGAGGHNAGNIASALATTTVAHYYEATQGQAKSAPAYDEMGLSTQARRLATAFQRANHEIVDVAGGSEKRRGMGTTLVACHFALEHASLVLGHVGDSRCYRLRNGRLELLTQDHTLVNDVLELRPDIDADSARRLPRNVITNALGMDLTLRVSVRTHELVPGDRYLLCSDGLTDEVDDGQIAQALQIGNDVEEQTRLLIDLATDGGSRDNIAVVVLAVGLAPGAARMPERPVPPKRSYGTRGRDVDISQKVDEAEEQLLLHRDDEDDHEILIIDGEEEDEDDGETLLLVGDDDDDPELEIVSEPVVNRRFRTRQPSETIMDKDD